MFSKDLFLRIISVSTVLLMVDLGGEILSFKGLVRPAYRFITEEKRTKNTECSYLVTKSISSDAQDSRSVCGVYEPHNDHTSISASVRFVQWKFLTGSKLPTR